jgi:hypothetical protein
LLEIRQDPKFQAKVWLFQRVGWCFLVLFLLAAACGYAGDSIFTKRVESAGGVRVEFPRFTHLDTSFQLVIESGGAASFFLSRGFLEKMKVETILPKPKEEVVSPEGVEFRFSQEAASGRVVFDFQPRSAGRVEGKLKVVATKEELPLSQWVFF